MTNKFMSSNPTTVEPEIMLQATKTSSNRKETAKNENETENSAAMFC